MGKMVMSLKKLGKKLTGQTVESDNTVGVINEIADKYEGGGSGVSYDAVFNIEVGGTTEVKSGSILNLYNKVMEHDPSVRARIEGYVNYVGEGLVCTDVSLIQINEIDVQTGARSISLMAILAKEIVNNTVAPALYEVRIKPTVESPESDEEFEIYWDFGEYIH